jgi:outer membrane receptor protein involved in Fe transport
MRKNTILSAVCLFVALVFANMVTGQSAVSPNFKDTLSDNTLTEMVVTAQRSPTQRLYTSEAITVLTTKTLRNSQLRTSPEVLSLMPGLFVQKTNHGGGSPFLRGLTGNQTLLLVDGIRLNNATFRYGPNQYFNTVDLFSLEKMEALSGGGSVQYGSDALGGTIQAFSRDIAFSEKPNWGGEVLLRGASQGMEQGIRGSAQYSTQRLAMVGGITARNFGDLVGGDTTGRQSPNGYKELDFDLKGKFAVSPKMLLTLVHQNVAQKEVPVYHKIKLENFAVNQFDPQSRALTYARLEHTLNKGVWKSYILTTSLQQTEEGRLSRKNGSTVRRYENDRVRSLGATAQVENQFSAHWSANSGIEIYEDLVKSNRTDTDENTGTISNKRGLYPNNATMTSIAAFTLHQLNVGKWQFTAGARWNTFIIKVTDEAIGKARLTPSALVGNAAIMRQINRHSNLFVSVNNGFRAPNIDDLGTLGIVDFRFETPNYGLQPEQSVNSQMGYKLYGKRWRGECFIYYNALQNLITRVKQDTQMVQGYPLYQKENSEQAYIQGVETNWDFLLAKNWTLQGSFTYTYGQNKTKKEPLRRIPPVFGRFAVEYTPNNWSFSTELLAAGKQTRLSKADTEDNRISKGGTPGWQVLNVHTGYQWNALSIRLAALNLFNIDYRTHGSGVNGYGRSVFVTLGWCF